MELQEHNDLPTAVLEQQDVLDDTKDALNALKNSILGWKATESKESYDPLKI